MRGAFILVVLLSCLGLVWLLLSNKSEEDKTLEARRLGMLAFLEAAIPETSENIERVVIYKPEFVAQAEPDVWALSGVFAAEGIEGQRLYGDFSAGLKLVCKAVSEIACWQLLQLHIDADPPPTQGLLSAVPEQEADLVPQATTVDPATETAEQEDAVLAPQETDPAAESGTRVATVGTLIVTEVEAAPAAETNGEPIAVGQETDSLAALDDTEPQAQVEEGQATDPGNRTPVGPSGILQVQTILQEIGFDPGPLDGIAGPRTVTAIQNYERRRGLAVSGVPTAGLLERLESERP